MAFTSQGQDILGETVGIEAQKVSDNGTTPALAHCVQLDAWHRCRNHSEIETKVSGTEG